jgi:hypothetical protein
VVLGGKGLGHGAATRIAAELMDLSPLR